MKARLWRATHTAPVVRFLLVGSLAAAAGGCGPSQPPPQPLPAPTTAPVAVDPALAAREAFQNPGGMWTPKQLSLHADTLTKLGLSYDPAALTDPTAFPLGAVVWLGGCSASFVSPQGLIITNHHCAVGALQFNSSEKENLLVDGFLAPGKADERSNGPSARVYVTQKFRDVSGPMRAGIEAITSDKERYETLETRTKQLVAECEKDRPALRCSVVSYFGGEEYMLIEQLEIRDVRLVYAPANSVGSYGGETDNWQWPRHSGDYSFFRAYVGPDGKPADYSKDNVPYTPKHHLKIASEPLKPHDLVMVAGYPGRTTRLRTAREVGEAVDWYYPRRQKMCEDYIALLEKLGKDDKDLAIKGNRLLRGLSNVLTNTKGMLDGLTQGGLKAQKETLEKELRSWAAAQAEHANAGKALDNLAAHYQRYRGERDKDAATKEVVWMSTLLSSADKIVHMAEERPKPDADRHPSFQERNWKRGVQGQRHAQKSYAQKLDRAKFSLALERAARLPEAQRPELLGLILGKAKPTAANIAKAMDKLYSKTKLEDVEVRVKLLESATTAQLRRNSDPFIQLALKLRPILQAIDNRADAYQGATAIDRPQFASALRNKAGGVLAPDANSTLRISFGTVRGYKKNAASEVYFPFTKLSGMVAKHTGEEPFNAPADLLEAAKAGPFGAYVSEAVGEVPVDFLSDLDITGGNSGSPTLNARGELVGLAFDGNYEAMASDWLFIPEITRSIHVDIRYVLWMMDRVDKADHLLQEMGVTPSL